VTKRKGGTRTLSTIRQVLSFPARKHSDTVCLEIFIVGSRVCATHGVSVSSSEAPEKEQIESGFASIKVENARALCQLREEPPWTTTKEVFIVLYTKYQLCVSQQGTQPKRQTNAIAKTWLESRSGGRVGKVQLPNSDGKFSFLVQRVHTHRVQIQDHHGHYCTTFASTKTGFRI
jgi:hypothetical protein